MHHIEFKDFTILSRGLNAPLKFTLERPRIEEDNDGYRVVKCRVATDLGEAEFCEFIDYHDGFYTVTNELMEPSEYEDLAELFHVETIDDEPKEMMIAQILAEVIAFAAYEDFDYLDEHTEIQL